jgi:hypothetical protein
MSSDATVARGPRRKWGWLFVILFLLQGIAFAGIIGTTLSDAGRARSLGQDFIDRGARGCEDMACRISQAQIDFSRARGLEQQAKVLMVVAGVCSLGTLALAFVGLRRRKQPAAAPQNPS